MCVLVVDDDEMLLKSLAAFLRAEGFEVECAPDAFQALELARQLRYEITAVLCDVFMPGMNGFQMWDRMKIHLPAQCPVLFMTGDTESIRGNHEHPLVAKSLAPSVLKQKLFSILNSRAA